MRKSFKELCNEVTENREKLKEQRELLDFLLQHDRNDVAYDMWSVYLIVRYIYKKELKTTSVNVGYKFFDSDIIENDKEKIIIKCSYNSEVEYSKYYKITKSNGVSMDITDIYKEKPTTVANPDTPTTNCENCAKKSNCKLHNKVNFSELMPKMIVCDEFTPTDKGEENGNS